MPDEALIVPILSTSGSLQFATVGASATVQDVTDTLLQDPDVSREVLGDLEDYGWALQRIRKELNGRQWTEGELEELGNGAPNICASTSSTLNCNRDCASFESCRNLAEHASLNCSL